MAKVPTDSMKSPLGENLSPVLLFSGFLCSWEHLCFLLLRITVGCFQYIISYSQFYIFSSAKELFFFFFSFQTPIFLYCRCFSKQKPVIGVISSSWHAESLVVNGGCSSMERRLWGQENLEMISRIVFRFLERSTRKYWRSS